VEITGIVTSDAMIASAAINLSGEVQDDAHGGCRS
jgi:hypothetical protein